MAGINSGSEILNPFNFNLINNEISSLTPRFPTDPSPENKLSPEGGAHKTIRNVIDYLEGHSDGILSESELLNGVTQGLSKDLQQLKQELKTLNDIEKNKTIKDKSLACYLQIKKISEAISNSIIVNSTTADSLYGLGLDDIESIDESLKTEFNIENPTEKNRVRSILINTISEQVAETGRYLASMEFFIQSRADFLTNQAIINTCLRQLEPVIQAEYYQKMQDIISEFETTPFYQIVSLLKQIRPFVVSSDNFINPESINKHPELPVISFKEVTKFHEFKIEELSQRPDYQILRHYLTVINFWVNQYLLNNKRDDWQMIIKDNKKLGTIAQLTNKLFENIDPELRTDWMREVRNKLVSMTNEKNEWREQKLIDKKAKDVEYKLEGSFFSRKSGHSNRLDLFSLSGKFIGHYEKFYPTPGSSYTEPIEMIDNIQDNKPHFSSRWSRGYNDPNKFNIGNQIINFLNSETIPKNHRMIFGAKGGAIIDETKTSVLDYVSLTSYTLLNSSLKTIPIGSCNMIYIGKNGSIVVEKNNGTKVILDSQGKVIG
jgi:hypothetical protein